MQNIDAFTKELSATSIQEFKDDPSDLIKYLALPPIPYEDVTVKLRGKEYKMRVQILTYEQETLAKRDAIKALKTREITPENLTHEMFSQEVNLEMTSQIVHRAMLRPEPMEGGTHARAFTPQILRTHLTGDELMMLFNLYLTVKSNVEGHADLEEIRNNIEQWIDAIGISAATGDEQSFLSRLGFDQLSLLIKALAGTLSSIRRFQPEIWRGSLESLNESLTLNTMPSIKESSATTSKPKRKSKAPKAEPKELTQEETAKLANELG